MRRTDKEVIDHHLIDGTIQCSPLIRLARTEDLDAIKGYQMQDSDSKPA